MRRFGEGGPGWSDHNQVLEGCTVVCRLSVSGATRTYLGREHDTHDNSLISAVFDHAIQARLVVGPRLSAGQACKSTPGSIAVQEMNPDGVEVPKMLAPTAPQWYNMVIAILVTHSVIVVRRECHIMAVPPFQDLMLPLLEFASDGQDHTQNEVVGASPSALR